MFSIDVMPKARRQLKRLAKRNPQTYEKIDEGIDSLAGWPNVKNVTKLTNHTYDYRLRVGDYRILFDVSNAIKVVSVQEVKKRDERTY